MLLQQLLSKEPGFAPRASRLQIAPHQNQARAALSSARSLSEHSLQQYSTSSGTPPSRRAVPHPSTFGPPQYMPQLVASADNEAGPGPRRSYSAASSGMGRHHSSSTASSQHLDPLLGPRSSWPDAGAAQQSYSQPQHLHGAYSADADVAMLQHSLAPLSLSQNGMHAASMTLHPPAMPASRQAPSQNLPFVAHDAEQPHQPQAPTSPPASQLTLPGTAQACIASTATPFSPAGLDCLLTSCSEICCPADKCRHQVHIVDCETC